LSASHHRIGHRSFIVVKEVCVVVVVDNNMWRWWSVSVGTISYGGGSGDERYGGSKEDMAGRRARGELER